MIGTAPDRPVVSHPIAKFFRKFWIGFRRRLEIARLPPSPRPAPRGDGMIAVD
jgi:hypothetical protein